MLFYQMNTILSHEKIGKWIGAGLGWTIGGPIGAILGFCVRYFIDATNLEKFEHIIRIPPPATL